MTVLSDPALRARFDDEVTEELDAIEALLGRMTEQGALRELSAHAHTIKGSAAVMGLRPVASIAAALGEVFDALRGDVSAVGDELAGVVRAAVEELRYVSSGVTGGLDVSGVAVDAELSLRALRESLVVRAGGGGLNGRVLVADDSASVRRVLASRLAAHGWEVTEARDGAEALELCRRDPPDILLLDIEMPRLNGFQVLSAMRRDPDLTEIPVIFLTAHTTAAHVADGLRRGAHDYLRKPFETAELVARLLVARRTKHLRDELRARNKELERLATTDMLTGLQNRRATELALETAVRRSARHGVPLSVLLIDIDRFKQINDRHGHGAGDRVLQEVASRLRGRLRLEDGCGRWGGEEFLVLLPDTDAASAIVVAEDLRSQIACEPIGAARLPVTISVGVADWGGDTTEGLVRRADAALYDAKDAGRDTVRRAAPSPD